jgi:hypothetical protein
MNKYLYVNLTNEQLQKLDALEKAIAEAVIHGCKKEDILDTVQTMLDPDRHLRPKEKK